MFPFQNYPFSDLSCSCPFSDLSFSELSFFRVQEVVYQSWDSLCYLYGYIYIYILIRIRGRVLMTPRPTLLRAIRTNMTAWKLELGVERWLERGTWIGARKLDWNSELGLELGLDLCTRIGSWSLYWKLELGTWSVDWNLESDLGLELGTWIRCSKLEGLGIKL